MVEPLLLCPLDPLGVVLPENEGEVDIRGEDPVDWDGPAPGDSVWRGALELLTPRGDAEEPPPFSG